MIEGNVSKFLNVALDPGYRDLGGRWVYYQHTPASLFGFSDSESRAEPGGTILDASSVPVQYHPRRPQESVTLEMCTLDPGVSPCGGIRKVILKHQTLKALVLSPQHDPLV